MSDIERELAEVQVRVEPVTPPPRRPPVPDAPILGPERLRPAPDDPPGPPSRWRGLVLAIALGVAALAVLLPIVSIWWGGSTLIYGAAAELLQATRGLDRGMFESARLWAALVNAAVLGWCLVRLIRRAGPGRRAWGPLMGLWLAYAISLWILIPIDLIGPWDISDPLTTFLIIGGVMLIAPALSALALVLLLRLLQATWRTGRATVAGHMRVVAGSTLLAVTAASGSAVMTIAADVGYLGDLTQPLGVEDDVGAMVTLDREWFVSASTGLETTRTGFEAQTRAPTMLDCHTELARPSLLGDPPMIRAVRRARRKGLNEHDAFDLAWDTLTEVCARHAESAIGDLRAYYGRAIENALNDDRRDRMYSDEIVEAVRQARHRDGAGWGPEPERRRRIRKVLALLGDDERRVLEWRAVEGYSHREIGRLLGKSEAAVAQIWHRARQRFRALCTAMQCRSAH